MDKAPKDKCSICEREMEGGVWTNGDGFGDGKYVGMDPGPLRPYCWNCYDKGRVPDLNKEIDKLFAERGWCGFLEAWVGRCRNPKPCAKHQDQKCWKCGEPAISNCSIAGTLVCGMPECAEHPHSSTHYSK